MRRPFRHIRKQNFQNSLTQAAQNADRLTDDEIKKLIRVAVLWVVEHNPNFLLDVIGIVDETLNERQSGLEEEEKQQFQQILQQSAQLQSQLPPPNDDKQDSLFAQTVTPVASLVQPRLNLSSAWNVNSFSSEPSQSQPSVPLQISSSTQAVSSSSGVLSTPNQNTLSIAPQSFISGNHPSFSSSALPTPTPSSSLPTSSLSASTSPTPVSPSLAQPPSTTAVERKRERNKRKKENRRQRQSSSNTTSTRLTSGGSMMSTVSTLSRVRMPSATSTTSASSFVVSPSSPQTPHNAALSPSHSIPSPTAITRRQASSSSDTGMVAQRSVDEERSSDARALSLSVSSHLGILLAMRNSENRNENLKVKSLELELRALQHSQQQRSIELQRAQARQQAEQYEKQIREMKRINTQLNSLVGKKVLDVINEAEQELRPIESLNTELRLVIESLETQLHETRSTITNLEVALKEIGPGPPVIFTTCPTCGSPSHPDEEKHL